MPRALYSARLTHYYHASYRRAATGRILIPFFHAQRDIGITGPFHGRSRPARSRFHRRVAPRSPRADTRRVSRLLTIADSTVSHQARRLLS